MTDSAALLNTAPPVEVTLSTGEVVTLKSPAFRHVAALEAARAGFAAAVQGLFGTVLEIAAAGEAIDAAEAARQRGEQPPPTPTVLPDPGPVLGANMDAICATVGLHAGRSPEWVGSLEVEDAIALIGATARVSRRFFTDRLAPALAAFLKQTATPNQEPPPSPGASPPTTTATATASPPA